jgi:hypothetical protein
MVMPGMSRRQVQGRLGDRDPVERPRRLPGSPVPRPALIRRIGNGEIDASRARSAVPAEPPPDPRAGASSGRGCEPDGSHRQWVAPAPVRPREPLAQRPDRARPGGRADGSARSLRSGDRQWRQASTALLLPEPPRAWTLSFRRCNRSLDASGGTAHARRGRRRHRRGRAPGGLPPGAIVPVAVFWGRAPSGEGRCSGCSCRSTGR